MADKKLKIAWEDGTFDVKIENLSGKGNGRTVGGKPIKMKRDGAPVIVRQANGKKVEFCRVDEDGNVHKKLSNAYTDGTDVFTEAETEKFYETEDEQLIPAVKNEKTEVFEITKYEPVENYLDKYQMDSYHQVKPSPGSSKSKFAKTKAINANTLGMKKLWDKLNKEGVVGRAALNLTSNGYLPGVAYIRAVKVDGGSKWTLEIAIFKQPKEFTWTEDAKWKPDEVTMPKSSGTSAQVDDI
jgi:hypothetical protein